MASLHPGTIFNNAGFNRRSTPLLANENISKNGSGHSSMTSQESQASPRHSPVATVYDVSNSSSRLILLNNKLLNSSNGSRLRGQSDYKGEIKNPDATRHVSVSPHSERHKKCWHTMPEKKQVFPALTGSASPSSKDGSKARCSSKKTTSKSHTASLSVSADKSQEYYHADYKFIKLFESLSQPPVLPFRHRLPPSLSSTISKFSLRHGEKHYLSSIAEIYGAERLRQKKFLQYNQLMWRQLFKGYGKFKNADKYFKHMTRYRCATEHTSVSQKRPHTSPSRRQSRSGEKNHKSKSPLRTRTPGQSNHDQREVREKKAEARRTECSSADRNESKKGEQSSKTIHKSNNSLDMMKAEEEAKSGSKLNDQDRESQQQSKSYTKDWVERSQVKTDSADLAEKKDAKNIKRHRKDSFFDEDTESISKESDQKEQSNHKNDEVYASEKVSSSSDSEQDDNSKVDKEDTCTSDEVNSNASEPEQKEKYKVDEKKHDGTDQEKQLTINLETDTETGTKNKDDIPKVPEHTSNESVSSSSDSEQEDEHDIVQDTKYEPSKVKVLKTNAERESEANGPDNKVDADAKVSEMSHGEEMASKNVAAADTHEDDSAAKEENENEEKKHEDLDISEQSSSTDDSSLDSSSDSSGSSDDSDSETEPQSTTLQEQI